MLKIQFGPPKTHIVCFCLPACAIMSNLLPLKERA